MSTDSFDPQTNHSQLSVSDDDIEALRREVERLQVLAADNHGLLESVLYHCPYGVMVSDTDGQLILRNKAAEAIWGGSVSTDGVSDWSQYRAFHPDGTPFKGSDWTLARCLAAPQVIPPGEVEFERFDGERAVMLCSAAPMFDEQGEVSGAVAVFADITELKHIEASERAARLAAEASRRRWAFVAEASSILGSTLDYDQTLERVAHLAVPEIADWCAVDLADERCRPGERVVVAHTDLDMIARAQAIYRQFPPDPDAANGLAGVLRSGVSELYPAIDDQVLQQSALSDVHLKYLRELGIKSAMIVPMIARGSTLGAITFVSSSEQRRFDQDDLQMAEEIAKHAALAIDNTRLFRETQQAWQSVSIHAAQQQAMAEFARRALEVDCENLIDEALERLTFLSDADAAKLIEFNSETGALVLRAAVGWEESFVGRKLASADDDTTVGVALRQKQVVIVDDYTTSSLRSPPDIAATGVRSSICVQVPGVKGPFGVLVVLSRAAGHFSDDDANLIRGFSNILSAAVERGRAEQQREQMYAQLTHAVRSREELLSIVSHDLRSPAAAVKLNLELITMAVDGQLDDPAPVERSLSKADKNIDRMVALMDDLLSAFRTDAEEMSLAFEEIDFSEVVRSAVASHERDLLETRTEIDLDIDGPIFGTCDRMRLQQVVSNLVSNAIKYGGRKPVRFSLRLVGDQIVMKVKDRGEGIPPDKHREIFERFRRADDCERDDSFGLGLWIVKRIVDALDGTIEIDSTPGEGTTFTVRLPRHQRD
jgi:PAS domain S-box-containing protein